MDQVHDNLASAGLVLDDCQVERLTTVSSMDGPPYPYGTVEDFCDVAVWRVFGISFGAGRPCSGPSSVRGHHSQLTETAQFRG